MPDLLKTKLSEKPVATNLMPDDRLVVLRRAQDEPDASRRNLTVGLAALQAWLSLAAAGGVPRLTLLEAQALEGEAVREQLYLLTGTPAGAGQTAGTWNGSGASAALYVQGYATYFGREGVLLDADGQPTARVSVDVEAGTYELLPDLSPIVAQHSEQLATLAARAANLYAHYADNTLTGFDTLDKYLAAAGLHGGTYRLQNGAIVLGITQTNRGGWPAFWDAAGASIQVPAGEALKSNASGSDNFTFGNFYLEGEGSFLLSGQMAQQTLPGSASRLFNGISTIPLDNAANVVLLEGGYYKKISGAGKYYLTGTVEVDDMSEATNVVDLRTSAGGTGTVKTVNGVAPNAAGEVTLPTRDIYAVSVAKRNQVLAGFTSNTQVSWPDAPLAGDLYGFGARFFDFNGGDWYELAPNPGVPDNAGNASPYWTRQA